jgi:hypothetical protein
MGQGPAWCIYKSGHAKGCHWDLGSILSQTMEEPRSTSRVVTWMQSLSPYLRPSVFPPTHGLRSPWQGVAGLSSSHSGYYKA